MIDAQSIDDTERSVLAAALRDETVREMLCGVATADWFNAVPHRTLFAAIVKLSRAEKPIDAPALLRAARAGRASVADVVLDPEWLLESWSLGTSVTAESLEKSHIPELRSAFQTRALHSLAGEIRERAEAKTPSEVVTWAQERLESIAAERASAPFMTDADVVSRPRMVDRENGFGPLTGIRDLDEVHFRLVPRRLTVLAGRPGSGKSACARQFAISAASQAVAVAYFAIEEGYEGWLQSRVQTLTGESYESVSTDRGSDRAMRIYGRYCGDAYERPLYVIDSNPALSAFDIIAETRRLKRHDAKLGIVVIDQMQTIVGWQDADRAGRDIAPRRIVDELVRGLRALEVHMVFVHQLTQDIDRGLKKREPRASDLADTKFLNDKADNVLFVYRPNYDPVDEFDDVTNPDNEAILKFGKRRYFAKSRHRVAWNGARTIFGRWVDPIVEQIEAEIDGRGARMAFGDES